MFRNISGIVSRSKEKVRVPVVTVVMGIVVKHPLSRS